MTDQNYHVEGLTEAEVQAARLQYGRNEMEFRAQSELWLAIKRTVTEPMMVLLFVAAAIYFVSGKTGDGIFLCFAIVFQTSLSLYQYSRSKNALEKLKMLTQPKCKVVRGGVVVEVDTADVVVGDSLMVAEGAAIVADGIITHSNDFSVNESVLTGESMPVTKNSLSEDNRIYKGTTVSGGLAIATVTAVGNASRLGQIGTSMEAITEEKTPLEIQIGHFVRYMALAGTAVFLLVWVLNYVQYRDLLSSLLQSLTLALSILPEEIPVAFTTFMALGAWRLMKMGIVVKQMKTVEALGSATVICTDKTGTLTENRMSLARLFTLPRTISPADTPLSAPEKELIRMAMWASEPIPFDPMEKALHQKYGALFAADERPSFSLVHEYPLGGRPPMMTHIFENAKGVRIIAAKGAPEALIKVCGMSEEEKNDIHEAVRVLAADGLRILGVGVADFAGTDFPKRQQQFTFRFSGLVAFYDPPKKNIHKVLEDFYTAGIAVKIITGDNDATTKAIARQIGFVGCETSISGEDFMRLTPAERLPCVIDHNLFTRMYPEAKLAIIEALKAQQQIVAMTGDGVNDGPALKAAHIGIAMGSKGTALAQKAASLILQEDDLSKMVDAIAMGRKIYTNLKKAIQYIISIHIPIILTVFIPLVLGWLYPHLFSPLHIIFLEVIMGPTCSIIYENEPLEPNAMQQKPRPFTTTFFKGRELSTSIVQGLVITLATLSMYQFALHEHYSEALTRTLVFIVLISANSALTLVNRSFYYSVLATTRYKNRRVPGIIALTVAMVGLLLFVPPLTRFFDFVAPGWPLLVLALATGIASAMWYEVVKWWRRRKST